MTDRDDDPDDRPRRRRRDTDESDDRPLQPRSNGAATAALILGILSLFCSFFAGIPAIIFGAVGVSRASRVGTGQGQAIAGLVLGLVTTLLLGPAVLIALLLPAVQKVREAAVRAKAVNDGKQIGLGVINFRDLKSRMPAAGGDPTLADQAKGQPVHPSLSWRVAILPYIEEYDLYKSFDTGKAWDDASNRPRSDRIVKIYTDPTTPADPATRYRAFVGPGVVFDPDRAGGPPTLADITDGTSNTILAVEAADKVPWPQFKELPFDPKGPLPPIGQAKQPRALVVFCDGSVQMVSSAVSPEVLRAAITRAGGENLPIPE